MQAGDILGVYYSPMIMIFDTWNRDQCLVSGHEFCGIVDKVASGVTSLKQGDRVVASFQIACGECRFCKQGLSSTCERTSGSRLQNAIYGDRTAGETHCFPSFLSLMHELHSPFRLFSPAWWFCGRSGRVRSRPTRRRQPPQDSRQGSR